MEYAQVIMQLQDKIFYLEKRVEILETQVNQSLN
jgi:hypothetical protein